MKNTIKMITTISFWNGQSFDYTSVIDNCLVSNDVDYIRWTGKLPEFELSDDMLEEIKKGGDFLIKADAYSTNGDVLLNLEYWASESVVID